MFDSNYDPNIKAKQNSWRENLLVPTRLSGDWTYTHFIPSCPTERLAENLCGIIRWRNVGEGKLIK